jgi:hypothetical protein
MSTPVRQSLSVTRRLQLVLLLMIFWEVLNLAAELSFGGPLFKVSGDDQIGGLLGGRGSLSGAALAPMFLYGYAFLRGPLRHRGALLIGAIEQLGAALFGVYHLAAKDVEAGSVVLPVTISLVLLVLLLINLPREEPE